MADLTQLDTTVFGWINTGCSNPVLDAVMPWISRVGDAAVAWLWIALICLLTAGRLVNSGKTEQGTGGGSATTKAVIFLCLYMALIYGVNAGVYNGLKSWFHRPRPFVEQTITVRMPPTAASGLPQDGSFPSGHASNAFMVGVFFADRFRRKRYVFYSLAALVAFSRVYLGLHYPGDVVAGGILGWFVTWLMLAFCPVRNRAA